MSYYVACFIGSRNVPLDWYGFGESATLQVSLTAVYCATFITALLGNILLIQIIRQRHPLTPVSILIVNMAASDLLTAVFAMPYSVGYLYVQTRWFGGIAGTITCKLLHFVIGTTIAASIFALLAISVERYIAVVKPVLYPTFTKRPICLSTPIWLSSIIFMCVFLFVQVQTDLDDVPHCFADWEAYFQSKINAKIFYSLVAIMLYILPLIAIAVSSMLIIKKQKGQKITFDEYQPTTHALNLQQRNHRVMRMLLVIVALFAVCWLPVHVLHILIYFYEDIYWSLPQSVPLYLFWISHANSALNPCVVILLNDSFRKTFMDMVRGLRCYKRLENRVTGVNYDSSQSFFTRRQRCGSVDASARRNKQIPSSPIVLCDITKISPE